MNLITLFIGQKQSGYDFSVGMTHETDRSEQQAQEQDQGQVIEENIANLILLSQCEHQYQASMESSSLVSIPLEYESKHALHHTISRADFETGPAHPLRQCLNYTTLHHKT